MKINEQKIQSMSWKVKFHDLQFLRRSKSVRSVSKISDMDNELENCKIAMQSFKELEGSSGEIMAYYKNEIVMAFYSSKHEVNLTRKELVELVKLKELRHDNLAKFIGACTETDRICFLMQYCSRGSLQDVLADSKSSLDWSFKISFITDIAKGMAYLHRSFLVYHGRLTSNVCMVDNRWVIKISGFGLQAFRSDSRLEKQDDFFYRNLLWTAPEHLKSLGCSQKGDVYSYGIIMFEILYRAFPYQNHSMDYKEIIANLLQPQIEIFRPEMGELLDADANKGILTLVKQCWAEEPIARPAFETLERTIKKLYSEKADNIVDSMVKKLEKYANNLENIVEQRTVELTEEKRKTDILLHSMLPRFIADELKAGRRVEPKMYDMATLYFSDIVGFTTLSSQSTPLQIVNLLNDLYGAFDDTIAKHNVYKVETIGDAYMVVSGLPQVTNRHVVEICNMALDLLTIVQTFKIRHRPEMMLMLRIGIHSGPCAAGVVGHTMPRYCLFGDTVNTASRMESTGEALKIHLSEAAREELLKFPGYVIELRGPTELKGKGTMTTYWLTGRDVSEA